MRQSSGEEGHGEVRTSRQPPVAGQEDVGLDAWDKFQVLSPFMTAVVVAILGYALNRTVNDALQEQQLLVSNVKEMRGLKAPERQG